MKLTKFENLFFTKLKNHFSLDIDNSNYPNYLISEKCYPENEYLVVWENWMEYLKSGGIILNKMPSSTKFKSAEEGNVYSYNNTDYYRVIVNKPTIRFRKQNNNKFVCLFECDTSSKYKGFVPVDFVNKSIILGFLP